MKKLKRKDLMTRWSRNLRLRSLKKKQKIKKQDKLLADQGKSTSVQQKAKQFLIFTLTQTGAFKRAGVKDETHNR